MLYKKKNKKKINSIPRTPKEQKTWSFSSLKVLVALDSMFCLCIFVCFRSNCKEDINPLLVILFANIFPFSRVSFFFFFLYMASFAVQKLLNLIRPHLLIFPFVSFALGK